MTAIVSYVLITGASGGIGSALCRALPARCFLPVVGYRSDQQRAEALAQETGGIALRLDMASDESIKEAIFQLSSRLTGEKKLVGVVLAASAPPDLLPFSKLTSRILCDQFFVNVVGSQLLLSEIIKKHFRVSKSGAVVGILSDAMGDETRAPATGMGAYVIAKTALKSMLAVCAAEYPWLHVRTVSPSFTTTNMLNVFDQRYLEIAQETKKFLTPKQVAELILNEIK